MTFTQHVTYTVTTEGLIERGIGQLPSVVKLPALSVTVAPDATPEGTAMLLMRLADQLDPESYPMPDCEQLKDSNQTWLEIQS